MKLVMELLHFDHVNIVYMYNREGPNKMNENCGLTDVSIVSPYDSSAPAK